MRRRGIAGPLAGMVVALPILCSTAFAAVPHPVLPGETLWSIAAANNFTTRSLAAYNGVAEDAQVYAGETIQIPTEAEAAAALASGADTTASQSSSSSGAPVATHVVQPGETLWSIATANGLSVATLAAYSGIPEDTYVIIGQEIQIPSAASAGSSSPAATHVVEPGDTLWSIATANGLSVATLAAYNGIPEDTYVIIGQKIQIPSGASGSSGAPAPGLGSIPSPSGPLYLTSAAAAAWNAMREESLRLYNVDLYPDGPLSAYRTYDQQAYLYHLYLSGKGAPANPPGTSSHELGTAVDVATPEMRWVVDQIGANYGWGKVHGPDEWWHVDYLG